ncbi:MAG: SUMF1/EgtB/PvdO family nonheme iron enzyme [Calditrichaeota bacterium]|nr:SUMF1/EgtB/PvdO family nonheme iron enzyme [Calditrichota bacterium]
MDSEINSFTFGLLCLFVHSIAFAQILRPIHFYDFDNGLVEDQVGQEDGTLLNGAGIVGGQLVLDGVDDYVEFAEHLIPTQGDFTVSMFVLQANLQTSNAEFISQGQAGEFVPFYIGHQHQRLIRVGDDWQNSGTLFPNDNAMHHVAVVRSAADTKLYLDRSFVSSRGQAILFSAGGTFTRIGRQYDGMGEHFDGLIDEVAIFDQALDPLDIVYLSNGNPQFLGIANESFDHAGSMPNGWTIQSQSATLTTPWVPIQEAEDDWTIQTSHTAFDPVFDEWLISPVYDLTWFQDITMGFTQNYIHAGSSAAVRYSINGGLSWNTLQTFTASTTGAFSTDVSSWADGSANVRFAFRFIASAPTGGSFWRIDDFYLDGIPAPPHTDTPLPSQPPIPWLSTSGVIGCSWHHPQTVSGSDLGVRIDANGDGDYLDGGAEDWTALPDQTDEIDLLVQSAVTFATNGLYRFEFRSHSGAGAWGYSGTGGVEGIADDWYVIVNADLDPPVFSDYLPIGQPNPSWTASHSFNLGVTIVDSGSSVDATTLDWRIDWNHNGIFDGPLEDWATLSGYTSGPQIIVLETLQLTEDGQYRVQFRATDAAGNTASSDMVLVRSDTTPPTISNLFTSGASNNAVELIFSLATDLSFHAYEVHVSTDAQVTLDDPIWGPQQDSDLNTRTTTVTTVAGLQPGTGYWFKLWARDQAGNVNVGSNVVQKVTGGTPLAAVQDLHAAVDSSGIRLTWTPPTTDVNGDVPVAIERYEVHASDIPWYIPNAETRIATTTDPEYVISQQRTQSIMAFFRVKAIGSGLGAPLTGMRLVPSGSFTMGPDANGHGSAHPVTLTHDFWMDVTEVTNQDYLNVLQWAYDQGHVTASATTVQAYGLELVNLDDPDCELAFDTETGVFTLLARDHTTEYGGPGSAYPNGYDPGRHPVKEVTWYGAACYCDWRSLHEGLVPFYQGNWSTDSSHNPYASEGYRLPTEAEWEYTARYNDDRLYPWGNTEPLGCEYANLNCVGWSKTVGLYPLSDNALGIKDLIGNILEYTNDFYGAEYNLLETTDPIGVASGTRRACRGSDFGNAPLVYAQSTTRQGYTIGTSRAWIGFRVVRTRAIVVDSLSIGLVGHYPLDANGMDLSSNLNHGIVHGAVGAVDRHGIADNAMSFNGESDYIDCGSSMDFDFQGAFSICAWSQTNHLHSNAGLVGRWNGESGGVNQYVLQANSTGIHAHIFTTSQFTLSGEPSYFDDLWHFYVVTWDGQELRLYCDAELSDAVTTNSTMQSSAQELTIGRYAEGVSGPQNYFQGKIDEIRLYSRALRHAEVLMLFSE